ncbi:unnamed protein product [Linum trigynum]|uniref:HD-ZIP protein N-terminal domain-containing protein n=1 Tax=Linum trigynum TaxID=586398 RepID=A0AAV2CYM2_9ROSI
MNQARLFSFEQGGRNFWNLLSRSEFEPDQVRDGDTVPPRDRPAADCEEEPGVSSLNSTVSRISGKRSERNQPATIGSVGEDLDADKEDRDTSRKKLRLSKDQSGRRRSW